MAHAEKRGKFWRGRYKKPDGKWGSISRDDEGQRFRTERSAEVFAAGLETDVRRKAFVDPRGGRATVAEWAELWLRSIDVDHLSDRDYRSRLRAVILPRWGDVAIGDITTIAYSTWMNDLRDEGRSLNSLRGISSVFRIMLDDAVASKVRPDNPIPTRRSARRGKHKPVQADEVVIATPRQALLVARNAGDLRGLSHYVMVLSIAYAAMRIGEVAGLCREDLMLKDTGRGARILLSRQSQYVRGKPALVGPKYSSARELVIPPFLAELLQQLLDSHRSEFVFCAPKGGRLLVGGDFYSDTWRPVVDGRAAIPSSRGHRARPAVRPVLGVAGMVPHGLRHSHKVWLDETGHPRVAVEERMGHKLPGVEGTYSHTTLSMELKIAESLQSLWESSQRVVVDRREYGAVPDAPGEVDLPKISQRE